MSIEKLLKAADRLQTKYYFRGDCFCGRANKPTLYILNDELIHLYCKNCFLEGYDYRPLSPKELFTIKIFLDNSKEMW